MSAWVIFAMLGLYPFCPGKPEYIRIKPQVHKAVIHCKDKDFIIGQKAKRKMFLHHDLVANNDKDIKNF